MKVSNNRLITPMGVVNIYSNYDASSANGTHLNTQPASLFSVITRNYENF